MTSARRYILAPPVFVLRLSSFLSVFDERKKLTKRFSVDCKSFFFIDIIANNNLFVGMEMLDHEEERRIEESFYEERERMRKTTNLPKKSLDHTLLRTKKFFGEASDQKESPKFSPVD